MRLFEDDDFEDAVIHAAEHFADQGIRAALIEKDDFVTEALRIIANQLGLRAVFKGGASLSSCEKRGLRSAPRTKRPSTCN